MKNSQKIDYTMEQWMDNGTKKLSKMVKQINKSVEKLRSYSSFVVFKFIFLDFSWNTSRPIKKGGGARNFKNWVFGWIELSGELSLGSYKIGFGPSKANPNYFWIWFRLTFVARPSNISQFVWKCEGFWKKKS
jgi:hypothetical protein